MKKIIFYIVLFFTAGLKSYSQQYEVSRFSVHTTKEGLSNNQINTVLQDGYGFIWIGTKKGMNRFDGNNFLRFYADSNRNSLPEDEIIKLKMLTGNMLAATTRTGLFLINTQTLQSKTILIPADSLRYTYKVNAIMDVETDKEGNIYLLTHSGFYVINDNGQLSFRYDYYSSKQVESESFSFGNAIARFDDYYILSAAKSVLVFDKATNKMKTIKEEQNNFIKKIADPLQRFVKLYNDENCLILLRDSVAHLDYYDLKNKSILKIKLPFVPTEKFNWRSCMYKISDTLYAITGKDKGFYLLSYHPSGKQFQFNNEIYFADYRVTEILQDHENRLWVGTTKGIFKQKINADAIEKFYVTPESNPGKTDLRFSAINISNDKIFAGCVMAGLFVLNRADGKQIKQFEFNGISSSSKNIYSCISFNDDSVLVGSNGPLIMMSSKSLAYKMPVLPEWNRENWVSALYKSKSGDTYVCYNEEGQFYLRRKHEDNFNLLHHNQNPLFKILSAHYISEDNESHIWFNGHGLSRYNVTTNSFEIRLDSFPKIKTARKEVVGMVTDSAGNFYFGVAENGLVIYHPATKKYEHITRSNGLPDNSILAIYLLKNKLWIGTESGIANYDINTKKITAFGTADDMPDESFSGLSFYFDSVNTHLYVPFSNSIIRFNPYKLEKKLYAPRFFIENIRVNQDKIFYNPQGEIKLSAGENNLQITMASINFEDAWQQQFFYRIIKSNKPATAWQYAGSVNNFVLNNLSPGKHNIEFRLSSKINSWQPQIISIIVHMSPPFWRTALFIITAALFIMAGLFIVYKARINNIRQKANRDKQLAELEILSLHAQMNPHFIFNALNSIKEMIWENDKQNASRYLSKFAQLIRSTLEQSRQSFITVKQCVQHLEQYLEMERIRFDDFTYSIEVDDAMDWEHIQMAPMLVQPLVENAIWHGLKNSKSNRLLTIAFYQEKNHIVCKIEDNGPGINHTSDDKKLNTSHKSISIINIHSRLQMLNEKYNMQCSLQLIDNADADATKQGTTAILRLSL